MLKYTRRLGAPFVVAVVTVLGAACSKEKKGPDSTALGADSTLSRDLALAAGRDTGAHPQLKDVPANAPANPAPEKRTPTTRTRPKTEPRQSAPRPIPAAPAPSVPTTTTTASGNTVTSNSGAATNPSSTGGGAIGSIAAGSVLNTHASSKICTNTNTVGDHVSATLDQFVSGSNGATIPAGATVNLTVTRLKRSENSNDPIVMEFAVNSVTFGGKTYPIDASVTTADVTRVRDESQSQDLKKVGIGAVAGAIAGKILGKSTKGAVIGGAAGAAAGAAAAAATANYQGCINSGSSIVVKLNSAATVRAS